MGGMLTRFTFGPGSSSTGGPAFQEMHSCECRVRVRTIGDPALQAVTSFMAPRSHNPKGRRFKSDDRNHGKPSRSRRSRGVDRGPYALPLLAEGPHLPGLHAGPGLLVFCPRDRSELLPHTRALFFDRDIKHVTKLAWDQAVNDTANLWQSILWNT